MRHCVRCVSRGKILRIILAAEASIAWTTSDSARTQQLETLQETEVNLWFADVATADLPQGSVLSFKFFWKADQRWDDRSWQVKIL